MNVRFLWATSALNEILWDHYWYTSLTTIDTVECGILLLLSISLCYIEFNVCSIEKWIKFLYANIIFDFYDWKSYAFAIKVFTLSSFFLVFGFVATFFSAITLAVKVFQSLNRMMKSEAKYFPKVCTQRNAVAHEYAYQMYIWWENIHTEYWILHSSKTSA